jgi:L-threonylcarbamoyladenylate synthase
MAISGNTSISCEHAVRVLRAGGIIAYPTEAVFGLGCDPFQELAVQRILQLKQRSIEKGLILVAATWEQVAFLVESLDPQILKQVLATWPGPHTWVFPASSAAPSWICGNHNSVALRISAHPVVQALCKQFGKPIVSTSANRAQQAPAYNKLEVQQIFGESIDYIIDGVVGDSLTPTEIRDAISGKVLREGG